ncbi:hypothetical protein [Litoreibacter albidus]|uniref:hypothetical protein n=1 Tax=Litoreibacter albidus TaxID=670155 RepID=UPI0037350F23
MSLTEPTFSETTEVGQVACNCHDCRELFEEATSPMHDVLAMPANEDLLRWLDNDVIGLFPADMRVGIAFPEDLRHDAVVYGSKLVRIRRIAAHHGLAFRRLDGFGVTIPFLGVAAFAANVVYHETKRAIQGYLLARLVNANPQLELALIPFPYLFVLYTAGRRVGESVATRMVDRIIYGNLLVFIEVYPIFNYCIDHFRAFDVPRGSAIEEFRECLTEFRNWWRESNLGAGDDYVIDSETGTRRMPVDQDGTVVDGIIMCLQGKNLLGAIEVARNEQMHTLQEFMYDRIDLGLFPAPQPDGTFAWFPDWLGDWDDPFFIATNFLGATLKFAYDPHEPNIPPQFIFPFDEGNVTEAPDRMSFTVKVITAFHYLYLSDDKAYITSEHARIIGHANDQ